MLTRSGLPKKLKPCTVKQDLYFFNECLFKLVLCRIIHNHRVFIRCAVRNSSSIQLSTLSGRPQANGLVEHFNRAVKLMLAKVVSTKGQNWDAAVLFAYRSTPYQSTSETPFYLVHLPMYSFP